MRLISDSFKALRKIEEHVLSLIYTPIAKVRFFFNGAAIEKGLNVRGFLHVYVTRRGVVNIGQNCKINSGNKHNIIGRQQKTIFWVEGKLTIGNNVGMSSVAIICNHEIQIGNNVIVGGNTVIYDTDFHSLDVEERNDKVNDKLNAKWGKVTIGDNVFIGAHCTILKAVKIGRNATVGACSVITKDIPENEVWAGNPAKCISKQGTKLSHF